MVKIYFLFNDLNVQYANEELHRKIGLSLCLSTADNSDSGIEQVVLLNVRLEVCCIFHCLFLCPQEKL